MNKLFYPAVFHQEDDSIWVSFPDFPECLTQGENMENAYEMAVDCLGLALSSKEENKLSLPPASQLQDIKTDNDSYIVIIEFDMLAYKKPNNSRSVKKTLSIPEWLNEAAIAMNVNFSQVLQDALLQKIEQK